MEYNLQNLFTQISLINKNNMFNYLYHLFEM